MGLFESSGTNGWMPKTYTRAMGAGREDLPLKLKISLILPCNTISLAVLSFKSHLISFRRDKVLPGDKKLALPNAYKRS